MRLREAASMIFALVTLVPFLALLWLLHRRDILSDPDAQLSLLLALILAVLGFVVLRRIFGQVSRLADAVALPSAGGVQADDPEMDTVTGVGRVTEIGQIGSAFARMLEDLRASTARLEDLVFKLGALDEVVELAARVSKIDDLLSMVLERSMRTVRATAGAILLLDDSRRHLRVAAARGVPDTLLPGEPIAVGDGFAGVTAQRGEPLVIDDVSADSRVDGAPGAFISVPVRVEDRIIGVISLVRRPAVGTAVAPFGPTDLQFLTALMAHVGYSVDNARLLAETRDTAARLGVAVRDLQAAQHRLVEGETLRAMGQMASGMAHHLNNLLAVASGRVQLLRMRATEPDLARQLDIANRAMDDAAEVVRRVLEFSVSRPERAEGTVDMNEVAREVVELARPRWHDEAQLRGCTIRVAVEPGTVPPFAGHAAAMREALMNVLMNAVDALTAKGTITVRTWAEGGEVYCSVSDDGSGMDDEVRRRAVEPFFTTKGPRGVGLGLSVAHAIVQRHRGDLTLESVPGRGTTATIHLPYGSPKSATVAAATDSDVSDPEPRRILLVDDEAEVRAIVAEALGTRGHDVEQAASAAQALERLESDAAVDLILSDAGMPGMTGWQFAEQVRARWPELPVGIITGWGADSNATLEQRRNVAFVMSKPFTIEALAATIARVPRPRRS